MSHRLGHLVGTGSTADVYEYGKGKVIKLYIPLLVSKLNSNRTMEEKEQILDNVREKIGNRKEKEHQS